MSIFNREITGEIVEVLRSRGELRVEWRIPRFLDLLSGGVLGYYHSPHFRFYNARWHLEVWLNYRSNGDVCLSLIRDDDDAGHFSRRTMIFSLGVRGSCRVAEKRREGQEWEFAASEYSLPLDELCQISELMEQKETLMPGGALTIECLMKVPGTAAIGIEHKVAEDMGKLLESGNKSDVTVQIQETEFRVHSIVLCARSPVLSAMLEHDTAERASHRINIDDCEPEVFEEYLRYLYTGSVKSLSHRTAFGLYRVADKYLADDLKLLCLEHIWDMLCVQTFCDTVKLAVTHGEGVLLRLAIDFATRYFPSIVMSVEWESFICEYPREANEILKKCFGPRR